jgi:hypothetical protein
MVQRCSKILIDTDSFQKNKRETQKKGLLMAVHSFNFCSCAYFYPTL